MDAQLVLIEGGRTVVLRPKLPTVIGRNADADMQVPHSMVSRKHCELYEYEGQLAVRDLGSVNGTLVNQHKIEQDTLLSTGDTLTIGKVTFRVEVEAADPESYPPGEEPSGAPVAAAAAEDVSATGDSGVVMVESEAADSTVHSESAVLNYSASEEGSFLGISETEEVDEEDDDDDGLGDFLQGLGG